MAVDPEHAGQPLDPQPLPVVGPVLRGQAQEVVPSDGSQAELAPELGQDVAPEPAVQQEPTGFERWIERVKRQPEVGHGGEKDVFPHPDDPRKVVAVFHNEVFRPAKQESIYLMKRRYYTNKILSLLYPDNIPDIHLAASQPKALVLDRVEGDEISPWSIRQRLSMRLIERRLGKIGIMIDSNDCNFMVGQDGAVSYVDSPFGAFHGKKKRVMRLAAKLGPQGKQRVSTYLNRLEDLSSEAYAKDIQRLDAEPWNERGIVDDLVDLQQQAFEAEMAGDDAQAAAFYEQMGVLEGSLHNAAEEADYATTAAGLYETSELYDRAIAAHCVAAKAHHRGGSPELFYGSFKSAVDLRVRVETTASAPASPYATDEKIVPLLRMFGQEIEHGITFSEDTARQLRHDLNTLVELDIYSTAAAVSKATFWLGYCYLVGVAEQQSLPRADRRAARAQSEVVTGVSFVEDIAPRTGNRERPVTSIAALMAERGRDAERLRHTLKYGWRARGPGDR